MDFIKTYKQNKRLNPFHWIHIRGNCVHIWVGGLVRKHNNMKGWHLLEREWRQFRTRAPRLDVFTLLGKGWQMSGYLAYRETKIQKTTSGQEEQTSSCPWIWITDIERVPVWNHPTTGGLRSAAWTPDFTLLIRGPVILFFVVWKKNFSFSWNIIGTFCLTIFHARTPSCVDDTVLLFRNFFLKC